MYFCKAALTIRSNMIVSVMFLNPGFIDEITDQGMIQLTDWKLRNDCVLFFKKTFHFIP